MYLTTIITHHPKVTYVPSQATQNPTVSECHYPQRVRRPPD